MAALAAVAGALTAAGTARAQTPPPQIVVQNGETQEAFGYTDAIRERVYVTSDFDSDNDGKKDVIEADIMRPAASNNGLKVPVIMDASPYYSTLGRGNESQLKVDGPDGLLQKWPLFLDNYFVPRGYAVVLVDMTGTDHSTGCPTVQGYEDNEAAPTIIDWLNGRRPGVDQNGNPISAPWHNGKTGMIGKSYDSSLAAAAATTGIDGLTTIVSESGPYDYYDYTRSNGVIQRGGHYLASLANTVTDANRQAYCKPVRDSLSAQDGDATANKDAFWLPRDYVKDAFKVRASVFLTHGMEDENVRFDHFSQFWYALSDLGVTRRARLMQVGHVDPFDVNRADWVDELHRWFDYWLQGVPNGILDGPQVEVETSPGHFDKFDSWPVPGSTPTQVFLKANTQLGLAPGAAGDSTSFTDSTSQSEATMIANPDTVTANRRVFLSPTLTAPVHLSGTPVVQLDASVANKTGAHFGAAVVDYGPAFPRVNDDINTNGVTTLTTSDCWGESSANDSACYKDVGEIINTTSTAWRVSKGVLDAAHRDSLTTPTPIVAGQRYPFSFQLLPEDYTFPAGHRIGVVIVGSYRSYSTSTDPAPAAQITLGLQKSRISLPIVGGSAALTTAGFAAGGSPTATAVSQSGTKLTATVAATDPAIPAAPLQSYEAEYLTKAMFNGFSSQGTPTGKVQFLDGGQPLGAPVALSGGTASISPALAGGSHQISATYVPEGAYDASTSAEISDVVPVSSTVGGTVPATLALTLGGPASFGPFTAGVAKTYTASTTANVISSAGDATLTWTSPTLTNGAFSLATPVQIAPAKTSWSAPVSNDTFPIAFTQQIGANDALRTGTYTGTATFTLSTTTP